METDGRRERTRVIFVHGALVRDGAWWWSRAAALLRERTGIRSEALALPSCGEVAAAGGSLAADGLLGDAGARGDADAAGGLVGDAAALRRALAGRADGSVVLVGHSYGGTVIAEAGPHPAVAGLLLISSYLPDRGLTQARILAEEPDPVTLADAGGGRLELAGHDPASFAARFAHDTDATTQRGAWHRVCAQDAAAFVTPTTADGWRDVDSHYLVCADDRSTTPALQRRHAERARSAVELPTGHHPFLSRPELVVAELEHLIGRLL